MKNKNVRIMTESALMIALSTVLSFIKIIDLPYGGSVTIASMLPVALIAYRHGTGWGLLTGLVHAVIQQLVGLSTLSYFTTWQSIIAVILLDYIVAFAVIGLAGIFRRPINNQAISLALGCFLICLLRYACHVIGGATVWAGLSIPTEAALTYSFAYNATYMLPEAIILLVVSVYVGSMIDFKTKTPSRIKHDDVPQNVHWIAPVSGLVAVIATIVDTVLIFSKLQDAQTGDFVIENLSLVNWTAVIAVTIVAVLIVASLLAIRTATKHKAAA